MPKTRCFTSAVCVSSPVGALLLSAALGAPVASPPAAAELQLRSLAASCAACHGTDGNAVASAATPRLAGLGKDTIVREMREFRAGTRPATVMQQIAKGFTDEQTDRLAEYFAGR
jgi:cytochrome c553